ncbi:MAG: hypothetical protein ACRD26_19185 [Vicinamibacterales bacterium]
MDRAWKAGAVASQPLHTENTAGNFPTAGDPGTGTPATKPGPYWFHMVTEELRAVIVAAGLTPDKEDVGQLLEALQAEGLFSGTGGDDEVHATVAPTGTHPNGSITLNLNSARAFQVTLDRTIGGSGTTTVQNPPVNTKVGNFVLKITYPDNTVRGWTWLTSTVIWQHNTPPTLTCQTNKRDWFLIWSDDGGTTWFGSVVGQNF